MNIDNDAITRDIVGQAIALRFGRPRSTLRGALLQALTAKSDRLSRGDQGRGLRRVVGASVLSAVLLPLSIVGVSKVLTFVPGPIANSVQGTAEVVAQAEAPRSAASATERQYSASAPQATAASHTDAQGSTGRQPVAASQGPTGPLPSFAQSLAVAPPARPAAAALAPSTMPAPVPASLRSPLPPAPLPVGELVAPPPAKPKSPEPAAVGKADSKPATEPAASLVIDVGERSAAGAAAQPASAPARTIPKVQQAQATAPQLRSAPLREELATLPVVQEGVGSGVSTGARFAEPVSERSAVAALPATTQKKPGKVTIVDIAPDGQSVLVTDPSTRLPRRFLKGDKLPNGQTLQAIDPTAGRITAGGDVIRME